MLVLVIQVFLHGLPSHAEDAPKPAGSEFMQHARPDQDYLKGVENAGRRLGYFPPAILVPADCSRLRAELACLSGHRGIPVVAAAFSTSGSGEDVAGAARRGVNGIQRYQRDAGLIEAFRKIRLVWPAEAENGYPEYLRKGEWPSGVDHFIVTRSGTGFAVHRGLQAEVSTDMDSHSAFTPSLHGGCSVWIGSVVGVPLAPDKSDVSRSAFAMTMSSNTEDRWLLKALDPPPVLTLTFPPPGMAFGFRSSVRGRSGSPPIRIEAHASDYLPQFLLVDVWDDFMYAKQELTLNIRTTVDLNTITTDPSGDSGNARMVIETNVYRLGRLRLAMTARNIGGFTSSTASVTVYISGIRVPESGCLVEALPVKVSISGTSNPEWQGWWTAASPRMEIPSALAGKSIEFRWPDGKRHKGLEFADLNGRPIESKVPTGGPIVGRIPWRATPRIYTQLVGAACSPEFRSADIVVTRTLSGRTHAKGEIATWHLKKAIEQEGTLAWWDISNPEFVGPMQAKVVIRDRDLPRLAPLVPSRFTAGELMGVAGSESDLVNYLRSFAEGATVDTTDFYLGTIVEFSADKPYVDVSDATGAINLNMYTKSETRGEVPSRHYVRIGFVPVPRASRAQMEFISRHAVGRCFGVRSWLEKSGSTEPTRNRFDLVIPRGDIGGSGMDREILWRNLGLYRFDGANSRWTLLPTIPERGRDFITATTEDADGDYILLPRNQAPWIRQLTIGAIGDKGSMTQERAWSVGGEIAMSLPASVRAKMVVERAVEGKWITVAIHEEQMSVVNRLKDPIEGNTIFPDESGWDRSVSIGNTYRFARRWKWIIRAKATGSPAGGPEAAPVRFSVSVEDEMGNKKSFQTSELGKWDDPAYEEFGSGDEE